jgi:hypothetical protein
MIIGEVEASPIRSANDIIGGVDYRTLEGLQMGEYVPTNCRLKYFHNGIGANQLPGTPNRLSMVDRVDEKLAWV